MNIQKTLTKIVVFSLATIPAFLIIVACSPIIIAEEMREFIVKINDAIEDSF